MYPSGLVSHAHLQFFFTCNVWPKDGRLPTRTNYTVWHTQPQWHPAWDSVLQHLCVDGFAWGQPNASQWSKLEQKFYEPPNAHSLCGTLPECAWTITIISPISEQQCDNYHPFLVQSAAEHQIPSWHHRFIQRLELHCQEVKQHVPSEPVALAVWEGQASTWGLSVADTEDSRTELLKDCHRHAVEMCKCSKAWKAAKWCGTEKSRVCKCIWCLPHIYLLRAKINNRYL